MLTSFQPQPHALAFRKYDRRTIDQETAARRAGAGLWSGRFIKPWAWRRGARLKPRRDGVP